MKRPDTGPERGPKTQAKIPDSPSTPTSAPPAAPASQSRSEPKKQNQGIDGSLARNGKIARLPAVLREAINRALARGVSGPTLLKWLNDLPEIKALLCREFKGQPISPQNLSQWRQGGFRDWLRQQEAREVFCEFAAHHQSLSALELNEKVALWLGARMVCMTGHLEQIDPQESWPLVRQMVRDVATLRRGDHRIREQKFKERAKDKITRQEHMRWAMEPGMLDWLVRQAMEHEGRDAEKIREVRYALFGLLAGDDPEDLAWEARKRGVPIEMLDEARGAEYTQRRAMPEADSAAQEEDRQSGQNLPPEKKNKRKQSRARNKKGPGTRLRSPASSTAQKLPPLPSYGGTSRRDMTARQARTLKSGTEGLADQGKTREIKANQSESKRESAPATPTHSGSANQTPIDRADPGTAPGTQRLRGQPETKIAALPPEGGVPSPGRTEISAAVSCAPINTSATPHAQPSSLGGPAGQSQAPSESPVAPAPETQPVVPFPLRPDEIEKILDMCDCGERGKVSVDDCPRCQIRPAMGRFFCGCHKIWELRHPRHMKEQDKC